MIVIVDSGGANLVSIKSSLARLGLEALVSSSKQDIKQASQIILPGVGSAKIVMDRLNSLDLVDLIKSLTKPVLGICVGMQILFEYSEEGSTPCLSIMQGRVVKLETSLSMPHMGWNSLKQCADTKLMQNIPTESYAYFVHNYVVHQTEYTVVETCYGQTFSAAVQRRNFMGVQFHPELSGTIGSQILKNFLEFSQ